MFFGGGLFLAIFLFSAPAILGATTISFLRNLKIGDSGDDVLLLQKTLNLDLWTRVSVIGPGSPGNETLFFGSRTRDAVVRFQGKYAAEVLTPVGLIRGTGFVGPLTRQKLSSLLALRVPPPVTPIATPTPTATNPIATPAPISNPNLINLEPFIESVTNIQERNNVSKNVIALITNQIRIDALTKGDFKVEFVRREIEANKVRTQSNNYWRNVLTAPFSALESFFARPVFAAGGAPFGGPIEYTFPCTCSSISLVYVGPPSIASVLDYEFGTQAYLSFNLPYAAFILGEYTPGTGGACEIYVGTGCSSITSEGTITSQVGSSS